MNSSVTLVISAYKAQLNKDWLDRVRRRTQENTSQSASPRSLKRWWNGLFWRLSPRMKKKRSSGIVSIDTPSHAWPIWQLSAIAWQDRSTSGGSGCCLPWFQQGFWYHPPYYPYRQAQEICVTWKDSEVDQELDEWQSSEGHDQRSKIQMEAFSQWHSPGNNVKSSFIQLFYQSPGSIDRMDHCQVCWWYKLGEWLIHLKAVLPFSGALTSCRVGLREI